jgi:hypothetical protein
VRMGLRGIWRIEVKGSVEWVVWILCEEYMWEWVMAYWTCVTSGEAGLLRVVGIWCDCTGRFLYYIFD